MSSTTAAVVEATVGILTIAVAVLFRLAFTSRERTARLEGRLNGKREEPR